MQKYHSMLHEQVERLINFAQEHELVAACDVIYVRNQYLELLQLSGYAPQQYQVSEDLATPAPILEQIYALLIKANENLISKLAVSQEQLYCKLMNVLLPRPQEVIRLFNDKKNHSGITAALTWFYKFSCINYYIKVDQLKANKYWTTKTRYGNLEITLNLSKPEKDPKDIAKAYIPQQSPSADETCENYPKCVLCIENEGFAGGVSCPPRHNHRLIPLNLNGQTWYFQFSPYTYYGEHAIIINSTHTPMVINDNTFQVFFDFVDLVPEYFIGSNTDIPIVGGSILTHDHFQAGKHIFPIEHTSDYAKLAFSNYPQVQASILDWPLSTIKLVGNKAELAELIKHIFASWYEFNAPEIDIVAVTDGTRHNAITPIMRKFSDNRYCVYLLLRNNRASTAYPDGIFHPHPELHHIKKENIGLIEAMGLAILPGRLATELQQIQNLLLNNCTTEVDLINKLQQLPQLAKHSEWIGYLFNKYQNFAPNTITSILHTEVGAKFQAVLEHCGVFKLNNKTAQLALQRFITTLNAQLSIKG